MDYRAGMEQRGAIASVTDQAMTVGGCQQAGGDGCGAGEDGGGDNLRRQKDRNI